MVLRMEGDNMDHGRDAIGFIGLGSMGAPLAMRLLQAGWVVAVHDPDGAAMRPVVAAGAAACDSARAVGEQSDLVFCCLPAPEISIVVAGELAAASRCSVLVETSTIGRGALARVAAAAGPRIAVLDCPISGGTKKAQAGQMTAIVAGPDALVERVRPCLDSFASRIIVVHPQPGMAQVCKIANNAINITGMAIACEALVMGAKAGLDPATMLEVINASTGRNSSTAEKIPAAILPRSFDYGAPIAIGAKDLHLYLEEAAAQGVSSLAGCNASQLWDLAVRRFGPRADMSLFHRMLEEWAGLGEDGRPAG